MLKSKDPEIIINNDLTEQHFIGYEAYYKFIMDHYRKYGNVPDISTFLENFDDFQILDVSESDDYLVDKIQEEYLYSQLVPILEQTATLLTNSNSNDALDFLKSKLAETVPKQSSYGVDIISHASMRYEEYINKRDSETPWMITTGFEKLDEMIGGLAKGEEFLVIVARTNQGKSWVLIEIATHCWKLGLNVGYISPEMSSNQIGYRFDTMNEHFSNTALFRGLDIDTYKDYIDNLESNAKHKFIVSTPMDFNKKVTISKLRNFCIQCDLDALFIDGITYLSDERYKKGDNKTTSLTNISEDIMALSCELKIPIVAVVQANRSGVSDNNSVPDLESIRDSDGISHNATKVISIKQTKNGKLNMEVKKNRNGPVNVKFVYSWNIDLGQFTYESSPDEFVYEEDTTNSFSGNNGRGGGVSNSSPAQSVSNKQPIVRQGANSGINTNTPF